MNNYTETIEFIDLKLLDKWNFINVHLNKYNIQCISNVHIENRDDIRKQLKAKIS